MRSIVFVRQTIWIMFASVLMLAGTGCSEADKPAPEPLSSEDLTAMTDPLASTPFLVDGIEHPTFVPAKDADVDDASEVIGTVVGDAALAFPLKKLAGMTDHVVNHVVEADDGSTPLSVTYCNMNDSIRVFSSDHVSQSLKIGTAGRSGGELLLNYGDTTFPQGAHDIPLKDIDFERTTFGKWRAAHPDTKVYAGRIE